MVVFDIKRNMTSQDIAEIAQLLDAVAEADDRKPLNDHSSIDLRHGGRPGFVGLTARHQQSNQPIAYCQISRGNDSWMLVLVVDPRHRNETLELGTALLGQAVQIIGNETGGHVHWWVSNPTSAHTAVADKLNFKIGRRLLHMRVELPLPDRVIDATKQITTQKFRIGLDEDAWLAVNNRAFRDHPEQGGWTKQLLQSRESESWFDPNGLLLYFAKESNRLGGFCWTKIDRDLDPTFGEIYVVAVDPPLHRTGLGRSLTVAGLAHLSNAGAKTGVLFVDQDNTAAVSTYSKLGFITHHQELTFVGDIASSSKQT